MREPRSYSTQAIVLKHSDFAEADRLVTLLTPYRGKIQTIAKGVRRSTSRKAGHLDLLTHSQLQIGKGRNLDIITQAETLNPFLQLRAELWHTTCGFYMAELVNRFLEDNTPQEEIFQLLLQALRFLDTDALTWRQREALADASHTDKPGMQSIGDIGHTQLLLRYFEIYLLSYVGYEPLLRTCAHCEAELQPVENGFTPALGGALCPNCSRLWAYPISVNALKVLRLLQRTEWARVPRFRLDTRLHGELENAMHGLLRYHLERELKSWSFLDMLRGLS